MGHNTTSHRKRYISIPGIGLTLVAGFVLYGIMYQPDMFTAGLSNVGSWFAYAADNVLWWMSKTPSAQ
jgi:hypothetical protein